MASIITATNSSGLTTSADNSGVLQLASGTGNLVTIPSVTGTAMVSGNMPAFGVTRTGSNQSISNATATKVQLNTEEFDTANCFDSTTNYRFTPNVAGYYQLNGAVALNATTMTIIVGFIYKNGSQFKRGTDIRATLNTDSLVTVSALVYANGTTDYFELYAYINASSGSPIFVADSTSTYFNGSLVRAA